MFDELLAEDLPTWLLKLWIVVSGVWGLHYYLSTRRYYHLARKIPAPPGLPVVGHAFSFLKGAKDTFRNVWNTISNSDVCKLWFGSRLFVFIRNPEDIELVLSSQEHLCKPIESNLLKPWLGGGINIASGCEWKAYRQLLTPMFQWNQSFEQIFRYGSRILQNRLFENVGKDFDCYNCMSDTVMELLLATILGENNSTEEIKKYSQAVQKLRKIIRYRQDKFWLHPDIIFNFTKYSKEQKNLLRIVKGFTRQAIKNRKEAQIYHRYGFPKNGIIVEDLNGNIEDNNNCTEYLKEANRSQSIIDHMMEINHNGIILMDSEIQNQVDALLLEGQDTTALTCSYFLCVMENRPDIQEKCAAELNEIFGYSDRPVTFQDTLKMKYLERCLMETLRMYPPIPFVARELQQNLKLASASVTIPANSTVVVDVKELHRKPELYLNPDTFDPDNFLLESCVSRHYYSFIPFSAGPRSCLGTKYAMLSLKVLVSSILRKYTITPPRDQNNAGMKSKDNTSDGFLIKLEHRKQ